MKQVIFLCLLSLTLCLSKPAETEAPAAHGAVTNATADAKLGSTKATSTAPPPNPTVPSAPATVAASTQATNPSVPAATTNNTTDKENHTPNAIVTTSNLTDAGAKPDNKTDKKEEASNVAPNTVPNAANKPTNETAKAPAEAKGATTSTEPPKKPDDAKAKVEPKDEDKHIVQARGFDGPSFIGGIILSLGLLAIGFMGFKYYKNQTERNYHTL